VSVIELSELFSGNTEGLARRAARPEWRSVANSCDLQGERPAADSGEEMALGEAFKVFSFNFGNASFID
jgi:hypothetical protein